MMIHERTRRNVSLALVLVLPLFLMSFAAKCDGGNKNPDPAAKQREKERAVDDLLRREVRRAISRQAGNSNTGLSAVDLHVDSQKRKVILTGTVKTEAAREEAVRAAREAEVEKDGEKFKPTDVDASGLSVRPDSP
jgi:hypothetical protein